MGLVMGKHSYGGVRLLNDGEMTVGKFCSLAPDITAIFLLGHRVDWVTTYPFSDPTLLSYTGADWDPASVPPGHPVPTKPIRVGNDVWIGRGVTLYGGADIGDGAVVGAGTTVAGTVPPYAIVLGNKARVEKMRFNDKQIRKLLEIRWWDWEEERIRECLPLLCGSDINAFIDKAMAKGKELRDDDKHNDADE